MTIGEKDFYLDLLFYSSSLRWYKAMPSILLPLSIS
jgi:predicted nuclease of restriction endonuclease-like (RecB) superfamily